jgi:carbon monoxide dehydrogenase subunit G
MEKTIINRSVTINASKEKVWNVLADFGNVQNLSPNVVKSYLTSEKENGVGASRHCNFASMGAQVDERITEWNEGRSFRISLYNPKNLPMMKDIEALFEVAEADNKTVLKGTFEYGMSNALGKFLNSVKLRNVNIKSWEQFMAGIKHNVETGEKVSKETKLDFSDVAS